MLELDVRGEGARDARPRRRLDGGREVAHDDLGLETGRVRRAVVAHHEQRRFTFEVERAMVGVVADHLEDGAGRVAQRRQHVVEGKGRSRLDNEAPAFKRRFGIEGACVIDEHQTSSLPRLAVSISAAEQHAAEEDGKRQQQHRNRDAHGPRPQRSHRLDGD